MKFELITTATKLIRQQAVQAILQLNNVTEHFGLTLTPAQAEVLTETRLHTLREQGLIEFGSSITERLIDAFCDSPYLNNDNWEKTLHVLTEVFYTLKRDVHWVIKTKKQGYMDNLTRETARDEDIIEGLRKAFDACHGSLELMMDQGTNITLSLEYDYEYDDSQTNDQEEDFNDDWAEEDA